MGTSAGQEPFWKIVPHFVALVEIGPRAALIPSPGDHVGTMIGACSHLLRSLQQLAFGSWFRSYRLAGRRASHQDLGPPLAYSVGPQQLPTLWPHAPHIATGADSSNMPQNNIASACLRIHLIIGRGAALVPEMAAHCFVFSMAYARCRRDVACQK